MTLEERLGCLDGDTPFWPGLIDMTAGGYYRHPWPAAHVERFGIPGIDFADGPRGLRHWRCDSVPGEHGSRRGSTLISKPASVTRSAPNCEQAAPPTPVPCA